MPNEVTLRDETREDGSHFTLTAAVTDNGTLPLNGWDSGPLVTAMWHCEDYEYNRHVDAEWVPRVLLLFLKERFSGDGSFRMWLESHGIPSRFGNWQWGLFA
ncbi:MAG: hypothetical protein Q8K82_14450 [Gemmatimonadaceae bacterium]|nr:hypothetical protein [Gemmatimonadaceae bacterium]